MSNKSKSEKWRQHQRSDGRPSAIRTKRRTTLYFSWLRPNFFLLIVEIVNTEKIVKDEKGSRYSVSKALLSP